MNSGFPYDWDLSALGRTLDKYRRLSNDQLVMNEWFTDSTRFSAPGHGSGPWFVGGPHAVLLSGERMSPVGDAAYEFRTPYGMTMHTRDQSGTHTEAHIEAHSNNGPEPAAHMTAVQNGYFEARITPPTAKGVHFGFWLLSHEEGEGHCEFDIVEGYGPEDRFGHSTTHLWKSGYSIRNSRLWEPDVSLYDGNPHTFGVLATDEWFTVFYDRKNVGAIKRLSDQRKPLYPLVSLFGLGGAKIWEPATMPVDYIRIWLP